jgi:hypothetical protein
MVAFPTYLRDDANDVMSFSSLETMQGYLEAVDVENDEFEAWDADGIVLALKVEPQKSEWLQITRTGQVLSESKFAEIKAKATPYRYPEPLLRSIGRKLGLTES